MKSLKILFILCIMYILSLKSANAQVFQKNSNQNLTGTKSLSIINADTAFDHGDPSGFFLLANRLRLWEGITDKPQTDLIFTNKNYYSQICRQTFFYRTRITLSDEPPVQGLIATSNFNGKNAILAGNPYFDLNGYFYHLPVTNKHTSITRKPSFSNTPLYRAAGSIFNAYKKSNFPALFVPK